MEGSTPSAICGLGGSAAAGSSVCSGTHATSSSRGLTGVETSRRDLQASEIEIPGGIRPPPEQVVAHLDLEIQEEDASEYLL